MRVGRDWRVRWRMPTEPRARRRVIWAGVIVVAVVLWWVNFVVNYLAEDVPEARNAYAFVFVFRAMVSIGLLALAYRLMVSAVGPHVPTAEAGRQPEESRHSAFGAPSTVPDQPESGAVASGERDLRGATASRHPAFEHPDGERPPRRDLF